MRELVPGFRIGYESLGAVLVYLYSGKVGVLPKGVCVCVDPECSHVGCRPVVDFMVEALFASFVFQVSELVNLFQVSAFEVFLCGFGCLNLVIGLCFSNMETSQLPSFFGVLI